MPTCYFCNEKFEDLPYRCTFCGMLFCSQHRLPENHECPFDLRKSSSIEASIEGIELIYQDALDYMNKELTVAKIYDYVTEKQIKEPEAVELLQYFLEQSESIEIRIYSIMAFKVLNLTSDNAYSVLESCILSDEVLDVKNTALEVIKDLFPKRSKDLINWVSKRKNNKKN
ncbi:MAG: AN1-type zinc finger domain-containing protein [Promethearchaeota archaeon]